MNYRMICRIIGTVLLCLSGLLLLPLFTALYFGESMTHFLITIAASGTAGALLRRVKPRSEEIFAREGFVTVTLSWIFMSLLGALPFYLSGDIPKYVDAFFETVSGFTTTGASALKEVETLSRGCMFWRLFTHWVGGMGVLVFIMAVLPMSGEHSMHILRAEVPGPTVGKLVPRARKSAMILYIIYIVLTLAETLMLRLGGMGFYDALLHSFATAGTGGFSTRNSSIAAFDSVYLEMVIATFMLIFSLNFNLYFMVLIGKAKDAVRSEELHWFLLIVVSAVLGIAAGIAHLYGSFAGGLRNGYFTVASIISTTGFSTGDFNSWPEYTKWIIVILMLIGGCAGSTAGGIKMSRVLILGKSASADIKQMVHPRSVNCIRLDGVRVSGGTVNVSQTFFTLYIFILILCMLLISFDGGGVETSFSASLACLSNVGPGFDGVGPTSNYSAFSDFSKVVLSAEMLLGRLEIYPLLMLLSRRLWRGN